MATEITYRETVKGGISVRLGGKFPTTLYPEQWEKLASVMPDIQKHLKANKQKLEVQAQAFADAEAALAKKGVVFAKAEDKDKKIAEMTGFTMSSGTGGKPSAREDAVNAMLAKL